MSESKLAASTSLRLPLAMLWLVLALGCRRLPLCPATFYEGTIDVPKTDAVVREQFRVDAQLSTPSIEISISDNLGTVRFGTRGPLEAFVYTRADQSILARTLFGGLAVEDGAWYPFWLYCSADGKLTSLAWETTTSPGLYDDFVEGSCTDSGQYLDTHILIPAHHLAGVSMTCGFSASDRSRPVLGMDRQRLTIDASQTGSYYAFTDDWWTVLPFTTVDCRWGSCGQSGSWFEIHAIVWHASSEAGADADNVAFSIFYLPVDGSSPGIYRDYGILLPAAAAMDRQDFPTATWAILR